MKRTEANAILISIQGKGTFMMLPMVSQRAISNVGKAIPIANIRRRDSVPIPTGMRYTEKYMAKERSCLPCLRASILITHKNRQRTPDRRVRMPRARKLLMVSGVGCLVSVIFI